MDFDLVIEFLGCVSLLQKLPTSSLKKIGQVISVKRYDPGDIIVREGEVSDGIYFIWKGEAEVCGSFHTNDENLTEFHLKQYDSFGHATASNQQSDVVALSKLTCLVLPNDHIYLLKPGEAQEKRPHVERILQLYPVQANVFRGITLPDAPKSERVFGGQFLGQALAAASKTVDCLKIVHSVHAYFLLPGDLDIPIIYEVHCVRDGKTFATRRVEAIQRGNVLVTLTASFQKEVQQLCHQVATMPTVPKPEELLSMEELHERRSLLSRTYRNKVASTKFLPWPIDIKLCEPNNNTNYTKSPPSLRYWFRAKGTLSDDQALHRCVVAYASDLIFIQVSLNPHREKGLKLSTLSLDHSIWFHRAFRADDWLLYVIDSPNAHSGRGFVTGQMFNLKGELVVSLTQEGSLRRTKTQVQAAKSKL